MQWLWSWQLCLNEYVLGKKICLIDSPGNTSTIAPGTDTVENIPVQASLIASLWTGRFWHMKRQLNLFSLYGWEQGMCWVPIKTGIRFVLFFKAFFFFFSFLSRQWNLWTEILVFLKVSFNQRVFLNLARKFKVLLLME